MGLLLRTARESRWFKDPARDFLAQDDVPADALGDLVTSRHQLSVWRVTPDRSNIERIVRAIAIGRDKLSDMGYILFDEGELAPLGIGIDPQKGTTPDNEANRWHINLTGLSGRKIVGLADAVLRRGETGTILRKALLESVERGLAESELPERCRSRLTS